MSNTTKTSLIILMAFTIIFVGISGFLLVKNQGLKKDNSSLQEETRRLNASDKKQKTDIAKLQQDNSDLDEKGKKLEADGETLKKQIGDLAEQKRAVDQQLADAQSKMDEVKGEMQAAMDERDKFKKRYDDAQSERDELQKKLGAAQAAQSAAPVAEVSRTPDASSAPDGNAEYWAGVLKEKAGLEVEVNKLKSQLADNSVKLVDLKQKNSDLSIQLDSIKAEKDQVEQDIKYKEEMVNNLSLELARSKNQKKEVETHLEQINSDNAELRKELQRLIASKSALEKSVVQITQQKDQVQNELGKTESVIQSKIDEIWQIKDSLDKTIKNTSFTYPKDEKSNAVELPAIVVSSKPESASGHGITGKVVSINEENHFVIIDAGENKSVSLGDVFYVYRGQDQVARLEVIQVRKEISAADIKEQKVKINVGDTVR
ncbi:MAG: hypothetical protein HQL26_07280 [Candidatus Omnitrophica bacterium]|nr:hypothetical protein [Candidatus Omnitrophota bacterium]